MGVYLGPLRLLATEVYENMRKDNITCNLLTGQERIEVPGAMVTSATVEMANVLVDYDVAVIDEVQMMGQRDRGSAWSTAGKNHIKSINE